MEMELPIVCWMRRIKLRVGKTQIVPIVEQSEEEKEMPKTETLMLHMKEKSGRKTTYTKQDGSMAGKSCSAVPIKTTSSDMGNDKTLTTKGKTYEQALLGQSN